MAFFFISSKNYFGQAPLNLFPSDRNEEKKKLLIFGKDLQNMQPLIYSMNNN